MTAKLISLASFIIPQCHGGISSVLSENLEKTKNSIITHEKREEKRLV